MSSGSTIVALLYFVAGGIALVTGHIGVIQGEVKVGARGGIKTLTGRQGKRVSAAFLLGGLLALAGGMLFLIGIFDAFSMLPGSIGTLVVILTNLWAARIAS